VAKISILCPSFNHQRFIAEHIKSVLNQSFKDFELIIVDDCSTDDNVAEINKFKDPRIKLIKHEFNKGINAALNTAFKMLMANI
jgi:glycosyltransferase involved in cell wall biosynthesis